LELPTVEIARRGNMLQVIVIIVTAILFIVGLVGTFLPILPGTPLILIGALIYAYFSKFKDVTPTTLIILAILMGIALATDYVSSTIGAKKMGAGKWGMIGALLGAIIGFIVANLAGLIIGPIIGVITLELIGGKRVKEALRSGMGTLLGFVGGTIFKILIAIVMIGIFLIKVW